MESSEHFQKGIAFFNGEKFYEAHEEWELIWLKEKGPDRLFLQGLIQLAGAFHHRQKGRIKPSETAMNKAVEKLQQYPAQHWGIDLLLLLKDSQNQESYPKINYGAK